MKKRIKPEFVEIATKDGLALPGLLYRAKGTTAMVYLHGNGSSSIFYNASRHHSLAPALARKKISILYYNNRGAHLIKRLAVKHGNTEVRKNFGMAHERIKDCVKDIDGAIDFLKKQGFRKFYLAGASTGANKICVYNFYKPKNDFEKYILLCGGDDTGIYYHALGKEKFWKYLAQAKRNIKSGRGEEIMKDLLPDFLFSSRAFFDIANPDGDYNVFPFYEVLRHVKLSTKPLFRHFKSISKPTFVVYGDQDEYAWKNVPKIVKTLKSIQPNFEYHIINGADHGFKGHEIEMAERVAHWL